MSRQQIDCSNGFQDACDAIDRYNRCIGAAISVAQTQYPATSGETAASAGQSLVLETLNALRDQLSPSVGTLVGVVANTAKIASVVNTVVTCHRPTTAASERDPHNEAGQLGTSICPTAPQRRRHGVPGGSASVERGALLIPDAEWRPIAFAILLSKLGRLESALEQLDPAPVVAEIAQRAGDRGLPPFAPPEPWPVETWSLIPLRAALVADEQGRLREFSRAAYRKSFVESL